MAVICDEKEKLFTIHTDHSTYQMKADSMGVLLHLYYGERTEGSMEYLLTYRDRGFSGNPYDAGEDRTYSLDALPQEYPVQGTGDYRNVCLMVQNQDESWGCDLRYKSHAVKEGKYSLPGLPAMYAQEEDDAQTLELCLEDRESGLSVTLLYGVFPHYDIITRAVCIENNGSHVLAVKKASSACLDVLYGNYDLLQFYGRHAMERSWQRSPLDHGTKVIGSRRGTSSHQYNPFIILAERETSEDAGACYGMSFVYSGSFKAEAERDQYDQTRILMGLQDEMFSYELAAGESFWVPEVIMSYSGRGLGELSRQYHRGLQNSLCRGIYKKAPRPVLINNWEATYFDFDGNKIYDIAKQASDLGVEMMVLDDGWFGRRNSDTGGLGDWTVNEEKLGESLPSLVKRIKGLGMKFGIWIEPEMVSEDSALYREHPDWAFAVPGRKPVRSRSQLVLDFSRKEVVDYIFDSICAVLDSADIEYVKWDMNRSISDVYSHAWTDGPGGGSPGAVLHRYVLGLYDFLERLTSRYPRLLIEGCSGGGGRFDAGMLYYTPQIWCSDNTDAVDRLRIQYGTSFGYPVSAVGSHVSAVPNHQTGRVTSIEARGVTAMAGSFGFELNLNTITEEEKEEVKAQIRRFHRYWDLIHNGDYYRLSNPYTDGKAAWMFVSEDKREALIHAVKLETHGNPPAMAVRIRGLKPGAMYRDEETGAVYPGSGLMSAGFPVPFGEGEYCAWEMHLKETAD